MQAAFMGEHGLMALDLDTVRRIARQVIQVHSPYLRVVATLKSESGSTYTELLIVDTRTAAAPRRAVIGADRLATAAAFRAAIEEQLQRQIERHGQET
jgi:hypothetical protein